MSAFRRWYARHVVKAWYRSYSLWVGVLAGVFPYLVDLLQYVLDHWTQTAGWVDMDPATKETIRVILLVVVLPIARAKIQPSMHSPETSQ